jgi:hypothetical protein
VGHSAAIIVAGFPYAILRPGTGEHQVHEVIDLGLAEMTVVEDVEISADREATGGRCGDFDRPCETCALAWV